MSWQRIAPRWRALLSGLGVLAAVLLVGGIAVAAEGGAATAEGAQAVAGAAGPAGALGSSKLAAFMFWGFALLTVGGAAFVITRRNMVSAVMGLVGTFFCLAGLYAMLYAHFLAVIQILVYAGAIMVLFVFVIMVLNRAEEQPWAFRGLPGKGVAGLALLYLLVRVGQVLWTVKDTAAAHLPPPVLDGAKAAAGQAAEFGSVQSLSRVLFGDYLFPFEAVSIVLLIAVVGAIAVARPQVLAHAQDHGEAEGGEE